jgi:hypothetical protein
MTEPAKVGDDTVPLYPVVSNPAEVGGRLQLAGIPRNTLWKRTGR